MTGIKETMELLDGLELVTVSGLGIAKGGLGWEDAALVLEFFKKYEVLIEAVKGVGSIPAEVKDLDTAEISELLTKVLSMANKIKAAI